MPEKKCNKKKYEKEKRGIKTRKGKEGERKG